MSRILSVATAAVFLFLTAHASAQQPQPGLPLGRLDTILPCGAKAGTTVEVQLSGNDLDETQDLLFSHPGIKAELIKEEQPKIDPKDPKKDQPKRKKDLPSRPAAGSKSPSPRTCPWDNTMSASCTSGA